VFYREASARFRAVVDLAGAVLFLVPVCVMVLWLSVPYAARSWAVLEGSTETGGLPFVFAYKTVICVFAVLLGLQGLSMAIKSALLLAGRDGKTEGGTIVRPGL
jgi:TRAP-type mannitol/chloroaromatic compound transport system permease small subunit